MENASANSYMLIFREPSLDVYQAMSPEQRQQLLQQWNAWCDRMAAAGQLQMGHPLEPEGRVIHGPQGRVTDGPYAEAKEAVGGFLIVTAADFDGAVDLGRQCPGLAHGMWVEVRQVAGACPGLGVQARPARELARS